MPGTRRPRTPAELNRVALVAQGNAIGALARSIEDLTSDFSHFVEHFDRHMTDLFAKLDREYAKLDALRAAQKLPSDPPA